MRIHSSARAIEETKRLGAMFQGLVEVLRDIQNVESVEQLADGAERRKAELDNAVAVQQQALEDLKAEGDGHRVAAAQHVQQKQLEGKALVDASHQEAERIVAAAQAEADSTKSDAQAAASMITAREQETIDTLVAEIGTKQLELAKTAKALDDTNRNLEIARAQMAEIEDQRAKLAAKLG